LKPRFFLKLENFFIQKSECKAHQILWYAHENFFRKKFITMHGQKNLCTRKKSLKIGIDLWTLILSFWDIQILIQNHFTVKLYPCRNPLLAQNLTYLACKTLKVIVLVQLKSQFLYIMERLRLHQINKPWQVLRSPDSNNGIKKVI